MTSFHNQALRAWPASLCCLQVRNKNMHWMFFSDISYFLWLVGVSWSSSLTLDISYRYTCTRMYAYIHSTKIGQNPGLAGWKMFLSLRFFWSCCQIKKRVAFCCKIQECLMSTYSVLYSNPPFVCWSVTRTVLSDAAFVFRVDLEVQNLVWMYNTWACQVPVTGKTCHKGSTSFILGC